MFTSSDYGSSVFGQYNGGVYNLNGGDISYQRLTLIQQLFPGFNPDTDKFSAFDASGGIVFATERLIPGTTMATYSTLIQIPATFGLGTIIVDFIGEGPDDAAIMGEPLGGFVFGGTFHHFSWTAPVSVAPTLTAELTSILVPIPIFYFDHFSIRSH